MVEGAAMSSLSDLLSGAVGWFGGGGRTFPGPSYEEWQPQSQGPRYFDEGMENLPGPRSDAPDTDEFRLRIARMNRQRQQEQIQADAYMQQMMKNGLGPVPNPRQGTDL